MPFPPNNAADVVAGLRGSGYVAGEGLATAIFLALNMGRPLLLEGDAGVGKTEVGRALAAWTGADLVRLQCYEGIDMNQAAYEWDYPKQLLALRLAETQGIGDKAGTSKPAEQLSEVIYSEEYLLRRPLLKALDFNPAGPTPVLLIDEVGPSRRSL